MQIICYKIYNNKTATASFSFLCRKMCHRLDYNTPMLVRYFSIKLVTLVNIIIATLGSDMYYYYYYCIMSENIFVNIKGKILLLDEKAIGISVCRNIWELNNNLKI